MANIIDHARNWGDTPFSQKPFGEADALVLSTLAYLPLGWIVSGAFDGESVTLREAARVLLACEIPECEIRGERDRALLHAAAESARFGGMRIAGFADRHDGAAQEQFAAATFLFDGEMCLAYRGTDGTLAGWKENFNMSFEPEVPAQRDALQYAREAWKTLGRPMILAGHSKGGNLAAYAGIFGEGDVRAVYSFDGPGFNEDVAARPEFRRRRVRTFVPQGTLVGVLLWHSEPFEVIRSDGTGVLQHDPYTWRVEDGAFVPADGQSSPSRFASETFKRWLAGLSKEERKRAIDGIFSVVSAANDREIRDLFDAESVLAMVRAAGRLDGKTRDAMEKLVRRLAVSAKDALPGAALREAGEWLKPDKRLEARS